MIRSISNYKKMILQPRRLQNARSVSRNQHWAIDFEQVLVVEAILETGVEASGVLQDCNLSKVLLRVFKNFFVVEFEEAECDGEEFRSAAKFCEFGICHVDW